MKYLPGGGGSSSLGISAADFEPKLEADTPCPPPPAPSCLLSAAYSRRHLHPQLSSTVFLSERVSNMKEECPIGGIETNIST